MTKFLKRALTSTAIALAAGLSWGAVAADDDSLPAAQAPEASAPRLPREVIEAASAYETFMGRAGAIDSRFADSEAIRSAMVTAESYHPGQMTEGMIGYVALVALQTPSFTEGVRRTAQSPEAAEAFVRMIEADPSQVMQLSGAGEAAAEAGARLTDQAERLSETGRRVKQSAYDVQHQAWSLRTVPDGAARLAYAKTLAGARFQPSASDVRRLFEATGGRGEGQGLAGGRAAGATPAVQRGLVLAALALLGRAEREEIAAAGLMRLKADAGCLQLAKLNLYQCLAVAGPHYEDVFCLGEHALKETGLCLRQSAAPPPMAVAQAPSAQPQPTEPPDSYAVPTAYANAGPR